MSPLARRSSALVSSLVVALVTVSCSGGSDDDTTDPAGSTATSTTWAPPVSSTETTEAPSTTAAGTTTAPTTPETTAEPTVPSADDDGSCLVGSWLVTDEQMNAYYTGLMGTVDAPITMVATGSAGLTFNADGTYAWAPDFTLVVDVVGAHGTGHTTGSITGSWSAADGVLATASDVNAVDLAITVNGTTFSGSDLANGLLASSPIAGVTYSCVGGTPVIDFKTADPAVTVPVTLAPA